MVIDYVIVTLRFRESTSGMCSVSMEFISKEEYYRSYFWSKFRCFFINATCGIMMKCGLHYFRDCKIDAYHCYKDQLIIKLEMRE